MTAGSARRILLSAVEPSGDALGAALMRAILSQAPETTFVGCGGKEMAAVGMASAFPISPLSVMGPLAALRAAPYAMLKAAELGRLAAERHADAAVLIDSWSFSKLAAEAIRKQAPSCRLIKYVAPQVWASRPARVKTCEQLFDGLLTLFPFEQDWFTDKKLTIRYVGNSNFEIARNITTDVNRFRSRHGIGADPVLVILLGSRLGELRRLSPVFSEAARRIGAERPKVRLVTPLASAIAEAARAQIADWPVAPIIINADERFDAFAAADAALAVSGTVTTELAIAGVPMVVAYKVHPLVAIWARRAMTAPYASLINIASGAEIAPEFIQENCTPDNLAAALFQLLDGRAAAIRQKNAFSDALKALGIGGASPADAAARAVLKWTVGARD